MKLWLSRQHDGRYMLTALRPVRAMIGRTGVYGVYARAGDPVLVRHLCEPSIEALFPGIALEQLSFVRVEVRGEIKSEPVELRDEPMVPPSIAVPVVPRHVRLVRRVLRLVGCVHFSARRDAAGDRVGE